MEKISVTWSLLTLRVRWPTWTFVGRGGGLRGLRGFRSEWDLERALVAEWSLSERPLLGEWVLGVRALGERAFGERVLFGERPFGEWARALGERGFAVSAFGWRALGECPSLGERTFEVPSLDTCGLLALDFDLRLDIIWEHNNFQDIQICYIYKIWLH